MSIRNDLLQLLAGAITPSGDSMRVHSYSDSYEQGREYRIDQYFTIPPTGGELYFKYVVGGDTDLTLSTVELDQGGIIYEVFTSAQISGESGIATSVPIYPKNSKTTAPTRPTHVTLTTGDSNAGATATFTGAPNSTIRIRTASGQIARSSTVFSEQTFRGFPPTTVYLRIKQMEGINSITTGVLKQEWVEHD